MRYLIRSDKTKFKANLGCFSTFSQGKLTPEQIKQAYRDKGYSIVAFSETDGICSQKQLKDETFLPITAYKTAIENYNFVLYSRNEDNAQKVGLPADGDIKERVNAFLSAADKSGFLVCIAHPAKSMQTFHDYDGVSGFFAIELADYASLVEGHIEDNNHVYDRILRASQEPVYPLAFDSNKNQYAFDDAKCDSFGAFTMIYAEKLEYEHIISALESGNFYCSTGPIFEEVYVEENKIHIKCSPVKAIRLLNEGRDAPIAIAPEGELITEATFEMIPETLGRLVRIDIRDENGNFADTVPFYFNDILGEQ